MKGLLLGSFALVVTFAIFSPMNDFVEVLKSFASNPVWALIIGGAISLLIWERQTFLGEHVKLKAEKRELYRQFVRQVEKCTGRDGRSRVNWHLDPEIRKLWSLQSEVELVAEKSVTEASAGVVVAINDYWMREKDCILSSLDGKERTLWENVSLECKRLVEAMKEELRT
ncbi:hypothetical protein [uncultured Paracoccus sp.]|uniref:hypothetical protein n=1 Tax=uncultured Paracoccus sp. TaxID=189685 RepID=UPI002620C687|nr:hypothetical protein [uncultured Paracoccus sp.]